MTIPLSRLSTVDPRQPAISGHNRGLLNADVVPINDKQKVFLAGSGPPSPMHRVQPLDGSHGPPSAPAVYEQPWRPPYSSSYDGHPADQRRTSNAPQPALPPHGYPINPNRELPQLPPDGPYARQGSLPGPVHTPPEAPTPHPSFRPMNGTPHEAAPHSAPPDYRSRMSFTPQEPHSNGDAPLPAHTLPPTQYPTPVPHMSSHTPTPYDSGLYGNQAYGIRQQRKAARAQQACDQCRTRKAKCDEGRPACSHCKENNLICVYKEVPPHKQEKATQLLLDRISQLEDGLNEKIERINALQVEHSNQLTALYPRLKEAKAISTKETTEKPAIPRISKADIPDILQKTETKEEDMNAIVGQELERAEGEVIPQGEDGDLSIPVEHTTAAHKLLSWPSIKALLEPREYDEDYVMKLEEERGLILVYGRGEGHDTSESPAMTFSSSSSSSRSNWDQNYSNGAPASGQWNPGAIQNGTHLKPLGPSIDDFGIFSTDAKTVRRYHQSYLNHMHKLHPFINLTELSASIESFIQKYCLPDVSVPVNILNSHTAGDIPRGAKRKRSCDTLHGAGCDVQFPPGAKHEGSSGRRVEKSLENAIVLLVLALGSICEVQGAIPGPVTDTPVDFQKERIPGPSTRSMLSSADTELVMQSQGSFFSQTSNHSFSPVTGGQKAAPDRSPYPDTSHLRNVDVIPGLAYYAYAAQILGSLQGANGLYHVQAALLAGLYAGQLAHPFQSHGWIYQAARACQVLVRSKRYEQMNDGPLKDLYNFAYWTCLQLESDILAELDLPASGISRAEARIELPKGRTLSLPNDPAAPNTMMMFFYSAQIHLRKVLNRVHTDLYKVEKQNENRWSANVQEILSMNLELWRSSLPDIMRWKDADPPHEDINVARMRAKYYGARYIIHRPLLYWALHHSHPAENGRSASVDSPTGSAMSGAKSQQVSPSMAHSQRAINMARLSSDVGTMGRSAPTPTPVPTISRPALAYRDLNPKLRRACKVCIDSAILSTEAFDGIKGRPVVTNIFGTAHAQFGNMLVLSATYMSSLSELVDRNDLDRLLKRTIRFLLQSREISPTLRADAKILSEIYEKIFGEPADIVAP